MRSTTSRTGRTPGGHAPLALVLAAFAAACASQPATSTFAMPASVPAGSFGERIRALDLYPGVTATIVTPAALDLGKRVDLILYALPNGNSTAETMGRAPYDSALWHFDIQHIAAQTRALRTMGIPQAVVVYLEANTKSWPSWRSSRGYEKANERIVQIVDQLRYAIGSPPHLAVTLTGHSGGGSFMFGFIEGVDSIPPWIERIAFLDANYNFDYPHGEKLVKWLRGDARRTLVVLAYDDREITLNGRKVVGDSGGTWRASSRMMNYLREPFSFRADTLGEFLHYRGGSGQIEFLLHPNHENRILHTVMIGEMNGYMHAMLVHRADYDRGAPVLRSGRAYTKWVEGAVMLPPATPPDIPSRAVGAPRGAAFMTSLAPMSREEREAAIQAQLFAGNVPVFLRSLQPVKVTAAGADSMPHTIEYEVMPDYLAIGSDDDFVRTPMIPYTAQAFCDAYGFVLPTRKMSNDIWAAATVHLDPRPLTVERESPLTFLQHHRIIQAQLDSIHAPRGAFVAGIKKDVVVTNKLQEAARRVAIYGWHYPTGKPIQPLYTGHVDWYVDYSHGFRPVRRIMKVDGVAMPYEKILADSTLAYLLSDEGVIGIPRYEK